MKPPTSGFVHGGWYEYTWRSKWSNATSKYMLAYRIRRSEADERERERKGEFANDNARVEWLCHYWEWVHYCGVAHKITQRASTHYRRGGWAKPTRSHGRIKRLANRRARRTFAHDMKRALAQGNEDFNFRARYGLTAWELS